MRCSAPISSCSEKLGELDLAAAFMHRSYEVIREKLGADAPEAQQILGEVTRLEALQKANCKSEQLGERMVP